MTCQFDMFENKKDLKNVLESHQLEFENSLTISHKKQLAVKGL